MRKHVLFCLFVLLGLNLVSQVFSNKGREFWVGYGSHVAMYNASGAPNINGGAQNMVFYFTSDRNATVKVEIPLLGWTQTYTVIANQVTTSGVMPKTGAEDARIVAEGKTNRGIRITSDVPIIAYAHIYNSAVSGATLLFPVNTLAREYYSINYTQVSNQNNSYCFAYVIATEDDTNIEIVPSANTINNNRGDVIKVTLNKGEVYNIFGRLTTSSNPFRGEDLTGTVIKSVATPTSPCKRIAVFSGSGKISITCNNNSGSADNYMQQAFPANAWGKKYLTTPTLRMPNNFYRIAVSNPNAVVKRNGNVLTNLVNNFYYEYQSDTPDLIESDAPIMVAQYITTANTCGNNQIGNNGDPEMIYLSPIEQTIDKVTINSTPNAVINQHYISITVHKNGVSSLQIDGAVPSSAPNPHPQDPDYVYYQVQLGAGSHIVQSDSGFNATAYGYGNAETYGYNAGANVKDLYQSLSTENEYATVKIPATCKGSPFYVSITLPYIPLSLKWVIPGYPSIPVDNTPTPASSKVLNGKTVYIFKLAGTYVLNDIGTYDIQVIANNPTSDGCTGEQQIDFQLEVFDAPKGGIKLESTNCLPDAILLEDDSKSSDRQIAGYVWDMGDGTKYSSKTLSHTYKQAGKYTMKFFAYTDIGCLTDTVTREVLVDDKPVAEFNITSPNCEDERISFIDKSSIASSSQIDQWIWKFSTDSDPIINTTNEDLERVFDDPTTVDLTLQLKSTNGCLSELYTKSLSVYARPEVGFTIPDVCLDDASAEFVSTTTVAGGRNLTTLDWSFGDKNASAQDNVASGNAVKHTYSDIGLYDVVLKVVSEDGCKAELKQVLTVNGATPDARFDVLNADALCSNREVVIENISEVDFGNVTKLEIYWNWDPANPSSTPDTTDIRPPFKSKYGFTYPDFRDVASKQIQIRFLAYSGISCVDEVIKTITLNGSPLVNLQPIPGICLDAVPRQVVEGSYTDVFNVTGGKELFSGKGIGTTGLYTPTAAGVGTYTVTYRFTAGNGCYAETNGPITVWPRPTADFNFSSIRCEKNPIIFTSSSLANAGAVAKWNWTYGDGSVVDTRGGVVDHVFAVYKTYQVGLVVESDLGCVSEPITKDILVHPLPIVNFDLPKVCLPEGRALFNNKSTIPDGTTNLMTYRWDFGDASNTTPGVIQNGVHNYSALGSYNVKLISTSSNSCKDSLTQTLIDVFPQPKARFNSVDSVCVGTGIQFSDVSDGLVRPVVSWKWNFDNGDSQTGQNPLYTFRDPGTYFVSLVVSSAEGCISDTAVKEITIHPYPVVSAGPDLFVLDDGQKPLQATATGNALRYSWSPATYLSTTDSLNPLVIKPQDDIEYTLTVTGRGDCARSDKVFIVSLKLPKPPNTFTPNGDGVNDLWEIKYLDQYPGCVLEVYTAQGQLVHRNVGYSKAWDGTFNGKPLPSGTYYYVIDTKSQRKTIAGYITIFK